GSAEGLSWERGEGWGGAGSLGGRGSGTGGAAGQRLEELGELGTLGGVRGTQRGADLARDPPAYSLDHRAAVGGEVHEYPAAVHGVGPARRQPGVDQLVDD